MKSGGIDRRINVNIFHKQFIGMKEKMKKTAFFLFGLCMAAQAALPENSSVIEAESFVPGNNGWQVKEHFPNWYAGKPSKSKFLAGNSAVMGEAEATAELSKAGKHHLWIRYIDLDRYRGCTFKVTVLQNGQPVGEKEFDVESLRASAEGKKKWGAGYGRFVWDKMAFDGEGGPVTVRIAKGQAKNGTGSGSRHLDVFVITPDLEFEPDVTDLYPLYVKVKMLPEQKEPAAIHIFGRRSMEPWFTPHLNINAKGVFAGPDKGAGDMKTAHLKGGEKSPWIEVSKYLSYNGSDSLVFNVLQSYFAKPMPEAAFELSFSKTPDEQGIFKKESRTGTGNGMIVNINLYDDSAVLTDSEGSTQSLKYAQGTAEVKGARPLAFPFITGMSLSPATSAPEFIANELEALKLIGITGLTSTLSQAADKDFKWFLGGSFYFHLMKDKCLSQPDLARIEESMKRFSESSPLANKQPWFMLNMMDEPGLAMKHITTCPVCVEGFTAYLAKQGVTLTGKPTEDQKEGLLYYWSNRYRNHVMTEALRAGTTAAHKFMPGIPTTVNFATEIVFDGNMIKSGCDWFEVLGSGALTMGWHEDWANCTATYQVAGFQSDVMRSACRPRGVQYGIYNILSRHPWDITAKGFMEIGHGNKAMHFFNYGPSYSLSSDSNSNRPEVYQAIKDLTMPTALVDQYLPSAKVAAPDAAMLFSITSDIWNDGKDNVFGRERIFLSLLLTHCNYRLDILSEDDLATELGKYKVLFATDSHLRKSQLAPLVKWVKDGGTLYLGAGALEFDEANQPLGLDEQLGLKREPVKIAAKAGRAEFEMVRLKNLKAAEKLPVLAGYQDPMKQEVNAGKGRVIFSGFFPGVGYIGTSTQEKGQKIYSVRDFSEDYRNYIASLKLPVQPRLTTDNYRVEANLLEADGADVIVLSNWTGAPQTVSVTLQDAPNYKNIECSGELVRKEWKNKQLAVTVKIPAGGYIKCEK